MRNEVERHHKMWADCGWSSVYRHAYRFEVVLARGQIDTTFSLSLALFLALSFGKYSPWASGKSIV